MQDPFPDTSNVQGELGRMQLAWLAAAVLVVSAGYGVISVSVQGFPPSAKQ